MRCFEPPAGTAPKMHVVIGPAMGVPQRRYADFAGWLARQGVRVMTFDFRGQGESLALLQGAGMRNVQATLTDWRGDYEAVIAHLHARDSSLPLYLIGHSMGAQMPGWFDHPERVAGLLAVTAGSGYWRENAPALRYRALFMWQALVPLLTPLLGYFPGARLGAVGDLPAGVIRQWRRWCLNPDYSAGAEGQAARARYAAVRFPMVSLSVTDDEMMTLHGTQSLLRLYANAPKQHERIAPDDHGLARIGHLGWFHPRFESTLWPLSWQALQRLPALAKGDTLVTGGAPQAA